MRKNNFVKIVDSLNWIATPISVILRMFIRVVFMIVILNLFQEYVDVSRMGTFESGLMFFSILLFVSEPLVRVANSWYYNYKYHDEFEEE